MDACRPLVADKMSRITAREGGKAHGQFAGGDADDLLAQPMPEIEFDQRVGW